MEVTQHGDYRARKRLGLNRKSVARMAEKAFIQGRKHTDFTGSLRRYLDYVYLPYRKQGSQVYVYGQHLYIFNHGRFVTTWAIPSKYHKYLKKGGDSGG